MDLSLTSVKTNQELTIPFDLYKVNSQCNFDQIIFADISIIDK